MKKCTQCSEPMQCTSDAQTCWCMRYPHIISTPVEGELGCLCAKCLAITINSKLEELYKSYSVEELVSLAKPYAQQEELIENLDYTIENGFHVFTAWYHLKRGSCCGNGCRYCPYGDWKGSEDKKLGVSIS